MRGVMHFVRNEVGTSFFNEECPRRPTPEGALAAAMHTRTGRSRDSGFAERRTRARAGRASVALGVVG